MPMTEGLYYAERLGASMDTLNNANKTPLIRIYYSVTHVQEGTEWQLLGKPVERSVSLFLTDKAWPFTQPKLESMGFNGDFDAPDFDSEPGTQLDLTHQVKDGKTYENWNLDGWGGQKEATPPPKDMLRKFKARWGTDTAASKKPSGSPSAPPSKTEPESEPADAPAPPDLGSDRIPF